MYGRNIVFKERDNVGLQQPINSTKISLGTETGHSKCNMHKFSLFIVSYGHCIDATWLVYRLNTPRCTLTHIITATCIFLYSRLPEIPSATWRYLSRSHYRVHALRTAPRGKFRVWHARGSGQSEKRGFRRMTSGFLRTWVRIPSTTDEEKCLEISSWKNWYLSIGRNPFFIYKRKKLEIWTLLEMRAI
jgi:hypothetical protein